MASFCSCFYSKKCEKEVRTEQHLFVYGVIKEMRKPGEFKLSLSNPRGGKILNSTTGDRVSVGGRGGEEVCFRCVVFVTAVEF